MQALFQALINPARCNTQAESQKQLLQQQGKCSGLYGICSTKISFMSNKMGL